MTPLAKLRRLGPWLLGLFLVAQLAIVMPSIGAHAAHAFDNYLGASDDHAGGTGSPNGGTRQGLTDNDDACTLHHHLGGIVSAVPCAASVNFANALLVAIPADDLANADRMTLDRPPKAHR
jgi:hypothetical protein